MATMSRRKTLRFAGLESLEARVVPSKGLGPIVALGDSTTDEYQFYPPFKTHARNWVETLAYTEKANLGAFSRVSRGYPRDQGFANNWAYAGATSAQMVAGQLPGAARQVATGKVHYAVVFSGEDNFLYYLQNAATNIPTPSVAAAQLSSLAVNTGFDLALAVDTLLAASPRVKVIVATLPSASLIPVVQANATTPQAQALVAATDQAIAAVNTGVRLLGATNPRVAVADVAAEATQFVSAGPLIPFGGTTINAVVPGENYHNLFLGDGLHLGTVAQGIVANTILAAADTKFAAGVNVFTAQGIVGLGQLVQQRTQ
jgi:hypothetical protein